MIFKKLVLRLSGALIIAGAAGWGVWVSYPASRNEKQVTPLLKEQLKVWQTHQALYAHDASQNSYLDPELSKFWKIGANSNSSPARILVEALRPRTEAKDEPGTSDLEAALAAFEPLASAILRASKLPVWVWESEAPQRLRAPYYQGVLEISRGMMARADHRMKKKEYSQTLDSIFALRELAHSIGVGDLTAMGLSTAVQVQWMTHIELVRLLRKGEALRSSELAQVTGRLEATALKMELVGAAAPMEVLCFHTTMSEGEGPVQLVSMRTRTPRSRLVGLASRLPGLVNRELRLYDNDFVDSLDYWKGGTAEAPTQRTSHTISEDLAGSQSFLSPVSLHQLWYIRRQILKADAWLGAERVMVALEAYRRKHGRYPSSLGELKLSSLPTNSLDSKKPFVYSCEGGVPDLVIPVSVEFQGLFHSEDRAEYQIDSKGVHLYERPTQVRGADFLPKPEHTSS